MKNSTQDRPFLRTLRGPAQALLDMTGWALAFASVGRLATTTKSTLEWVVVAVAAVAVVIGGSLLVGGYSARWRVAEFAHVQVIAPLGLLAGLTATILFRLLSFEQPMLYGASATAIGMASTLGVRGVWRTAYDRRVAGAPLSGSPVIIYGAGEGGRRMIDALTADATSNLRPVAVLDDDPFLRGRHIGGLVVEGGREVLPSVAQRTGATDLLVAIPSADRFLVRSLEQAGIECGLNVVVLPSVSEMVGNVLRPNMIRKITPADLLGRQPVDLRLANRSEYLAGKTVLVTGAGGSIGSELCRQLNHLGPKSLLMLDRDESALHQLQLSIDGQAQLRSKELIVADIREHDRLEQIFAEWQPDLVFHAAALKHLPLLEMHPFEGLRTNVFGTRNLLDCACRHDVDLFVNVSTDKAADPSSVLGWTKRIAERLTAKAGLVCSGRFVSVRFGNVLGSRGSVLTAFERQIESGGPVTVTHPEITRYFMTVEEAASLVIVAGGEGDTGDVLILEMGEPVRIVDVAEELIRRSGRDIDIVFTGLRPGEKMHEVLRATDEVIVKTEDDLMWRGAAEPLSWDDVAALSAVPTPDRLVEELERVSALEYDGGHPLSILLSPPEVGDAERTNVLRALNSGWIAPAGAELDQFEAELAMSTGCERALALNSGTAALHLGLLVAGVQPGDDVVVQTTTFAASAFAVRYAGANPVFCDVDHSTGMMDPEQLAAFLKRRASSGRLPTAVMPVDLYGACANYAAIRRVCDRYEIPVVQDAAEAVGAVSQGCAAGSHGLVGALSFNGNKIITTGGGGALVGPSILLERALKLATQARETVPHYEHREVGFNYRMSNVLAAIGRAQLQDLDRRIEVRGQVKRAYAAAVPELDWMPEGVTERANNWLHVGLLPPGVDPAAAVSVLHDKGIDARRSWKPMHLQPVFAGYETIGGEVAEGFYSRGICLPSSQALNAEEIDRVSEVLSLAVASSLRPEVQSS